MSMPSAHRRHAALVRHPLLDCFGRASACGPRCRVKTRRITWSPGAACRCYIITATVFATWFGSETVLGIPAKFLSEGLGGIIADPFGSSMCLILVGLFFARPFYRMNLLTIGDYYRTALQPRGRDADDASAS